MQYPSPSRLALSLSALLASNQLLAAGFAINEQSVSAMSTAFAGRSSSALDASTVYGNPAGMSYLKEQVSGGMALISAGTDIDHVDSNYRGSNDGDMVPLAAIPFGYYVKPLDEQWTFGLIVTGKQLRAVAAGSRAPLIVWKSWVLTMRFSSFAFNVSFVPSSLQRVS